VFRRWFCFCRGLYLTCLCFRGLRLSCVRLRSQDDGSGLAANLNQDAPRVRHDESGVIGRWINFEHHARQVWAIRREADAAHKAISQVIVLAQQFLSEQSVAQIEEDALRPGHASTLVTDFAIKINGYTRVFRRGPVAN